MPFDDKTLVFKVAGKIFALAALDVHPLRLNLKCDPEKAIDLRERFESVDLVIIQIKSIGILLR